MSDHNTGFAGGTEGADEVPEVDEDYGHNDEETEEEDTWMPEEDADPDIDDEVTFPDNGDDSHADDDVDDPDVLDDDSEAVG